MAIALKLPKNPFLKTSTPENQIQLPKAADLHFVEQHKTQMEVKKMYRKLLGLAVAVLLLTMLAAPVFAKSPNKFPATAAITGIDGFDPNTISYRVTNDGVIHLDNFEFWGPIALSLNGGTPIAVEWYDVCSGIYSPSSNRGIYRFDEVWSIDGEAAFVGTDHLVCEGNLLTETIDSFHSHIVLHGVGDYAGQVLDLWMYPENYPVLVGTWLKPT